MALTHKQIVSEKLGEKPHKLFDEKGLYLLIQPSGGKWWRFKYRHEGKEKGMSLGTFPEVPLTDARALRDAARAQVAKGIDPSAARQAQKAAAGGAGTFEAVAREWHTKFSPRWTVEHAERILRRFEADLFPWLGSKPLNVIEAPELLSAIRRVESRGALDTAHRALQNAGQVFRYGVATGRCPRDPSGDLRGALPPVKERHHASITDPAGIGDLLRAMGGYKGALITKVALNIAPHVFVRPGELRRAEWIEFDLDKAEWRIPAIKMKMRVVHIVPLSEQVVAMLKELQPLTGRGKYLFPSVRDDKRPMSENTILGALRRLGYTGQEMSGHGFRSLASTRLHEMGWPPDAIERQLAHSEPNKSKKAYDYSKHLLERRKMMQVWSNYLDSLRLGNVVHGSFVKAA